MTRSKESMEAFSSEPPSRMPAAFTRPRSGPSLVVTASIRRATSPSSVRSAAKVWMEPAGALAASSARRSCRRPVAATVQPRWARRRAVASPMPLVAPETRARGGWDTVTSLGHCSALQLLECSHHVFCEPRQAELTQDPLTRGISQPCAEGRIVCEPNNRLC